MAVLAGTTASEWRIKQENTFFFAREVIGPAGYVGLYRDTNTSKLVLLGGDRAASE
jgi:hypothetical protein